jgi:peptidoglycan/xylan/chitin deacetylase (PgdA/CDA1 family)
MVDQKIYPFYTWSVPTKEKILYLTFDDGPHPEATPFVLTELKKFGALATFFCIVRMYWRGRKFIREY